MAKTTDPSSSSSSSSFDPILWADFVDALARRVGPHAPEALNRFRARVHQVVRGFAAKTTSAALVRVCARPIIGVTYIQLLTSLGIAPEPPTPEFIERLIDDALAS